MNTIYRTPPEGRSCWCDRAHPPFTGNHRPDTSDPEWPMGSPSCMCGGGAWGIPHHT